MKVTMVVPTYWARASGEGWKAGDAVYDHPTPLDQDGTLLRMLQSVEVLQDKDFRIVVIAAPTAPDIAARVEAKVGALIHAASGAGVETLLFGPSHLKRIHEVLSEAGREDSCELLQLRGYSNLRNLCLFLPHVLASDAAVLIDDDEVFEDPQYLSKAREFIGRTVDGKWVGAVAGYYLQPDGEYRLKKGTRPWMRIWDQVKNMNQAFERTIGSEPRLKATPFVFGGNMVVHRDLFTVVPFDPNVRRGEDIDFLINARMFGFEFFLDNQLAIKHLPPPKTHPRWKQFREDIFRFVYEKAKIEGQSGVSGMTRVTPEEFNPYPGCFLKPDLQEKVAKSCELLAQEFFDQGDRKAAEETLKNIAIAKTEAEPEANPFETLCQLQNRWEALMKQVGRQSLRSKMAKILTGNAR